MNQYYSLLLNLSVMDLGSFLKGAGRQRHSRRNSPINSFFLLSVLRDYHGGV